MEYTLTVFLFGLGAAMLVGLSKTGVPGVAIPAVVLMTEAFSGDAKLLVGALLPVLLLGDLFAVGYYRHHAQWKRLWGLFPYVLAGMVPGACVLLWADQGQFKALLGWMVLILLALELCRQKFALTNMPNRWWFVATMGVLAGFGTTVGNAAGPVMTIYLIGRGMEKEHFMGTWAWFFLIVNSVKVPLFLSMKYLSSDTVCMITPETLRFDLVLLPAAAVAALIGRRVFSIIPQKVFDPLVLLLAGVAAVRLITA